jgi:threonine dehydrogenase-like Zn-dependent dehydrogenase
MRATVSAGHAHSARVGDVPEPPETDGAGFGSLELDIVMKYAGAPAVVIDVIRRNASDGIVCLAGLSSGSHKMNFDFGDLNRTMAMKNDVVFGTVNTNRSHYEMGADSLTKSHKGWLRRMITRRVALHRWKEAGREISRSGPILVNN